MSFTKLKFLAPVLAAFILGCSFMGLTATDQSTSGSEQQDPRLVARDNMILARQAQLDENRRLISELKTVGVDVHDSSKGIVISLPDVLFQSGSAKLTSKASTTISQIAQVIKRTVERRISIEGHTDDVGSISYNYELSRDRATSVANQLAYDGVVKELIDTKGFGETEPMATNRTDNGRTQNRRVEVIIKNRVS